MKKSIILGIICSIASLLLIGCNNPNIPNELSGLLDEKSCVAEGILYVSDLPYDKKPLGDPLAGMWLSTDDGSYCVVTDAGAFVENDTLCVGEPVVCAKIGDIVRAYGISRSYKNYTGSIYRKLTIDSLEVLKTREERGDTIEGVIRGTLLLTSRQVTIKVDQTFYNVKSSCYTYHQPTDCILLAGELFCIDGEITCEEVEATGTIYTYVNWLGWGLTLEHEIFVKQIKRL